MIENNYRCSDRYAKSRRPGVARWENICVSKNNTTNIFNRKREVRSPVLLLRNRIKRRNFYSIILEFTPTLNTHIALNLKFGIRFGVSPSFMFRNGRADGFFFFFFGGSVLAEYKTLYSSYPGLSHGDDLSTITPRGVPD